MAAPVVDAPPAVAEDATGLVARAVTPAGEPVAGVRLVAFRDEGRPIGAEALAGPDGVARLDVTHGEWRLRALDGRWCAVPVSATAPSSHAVDVVVAPGRRLVLRIHDDAGAAVAGAQVHGDEAPEVLASAEGIVELVVSTRRISLWAASPGHVPFHGPIDAALSPQDVRLPRGGTLIVHVREADGRVVPSAEVSVSHDMSCARVRADAAGDAVLDGWATTGVVDVTAASATGNSHQERIELPPGVARHEVEIRLPSGRVLAGTVVRAGTGTPIAEARILYMRSSDDWQELARTGADGRFRIADFWGERGEAASFVVVAPGFAQRQEASDEIAPIAGSDPDEFTIEMLDSASIGGRVVDASGRPVVGARVVAMENMNWPEPCHAVTVRDGRFEIAAVPSWAEGLVVRRERDVAGLPVACSSLAPGERRDVGDVVLPETFDWTAEIVDAEGRPVSRGTLKVTGWTQLDLFSEGVRRDVLDGKFAAVRGVSAGAHVHVWIDGHRFAERAITRDLRRIVVEPALRVRGRVVAATTGEPLVRAEVFLLRVAPDCGLVTAVSGPDGAFEIVGIGPGRYAATRNVNVVFAQQETGAPATSCVATVERDGQDLGTIRLE